MRLTAGTEDPVKTFLAGLRKITRDRYKRAVLRRAFRIGLQPQTWSILSALGDGVSHQAALTIATLYAEHPKVELGDLSLGFTCRRIATNMSASQEVPDMFNCQFRRLLDCDSLEEVDIQLKGWIRAAYATGLGVNYELLFRDLLSWNTSAERVKENWACGFWLVPTDTNKQPAVAKGLE